MNNETIVKNYYDGWAEKVRLTRDKGRNIEYILTMDFINKYLPGNEKILELGCGAGIFSLAWLKKDMMLRQLIFLKKI
jgi:ubiquinone/menaquinone biosynthesis C-methylase UbiE